MAIPKEVIDKIKDSIDIVDVISDFVDLKKKGKDFVALSPFSQEKTPSFYVIPSKGFFKDFSSGKAGDAIKFIMEHESLSYPETLKFLAKKYGIDFQEEEKTPEEIALQSEKDAVYIVMQYANKFFRNNLKEHADGKAIGQSYFKERGYNREIQESFQLGYSLDTWDGLLNAAIKAGYKEEILEKAGLIIINEDRKKKYDRFRGRVMFPIFTVTGKPIAFGARTLQKDEKPKYLNSPETPVYHKSDVLYGIYQGYNEIRNQDRCYLVEGYTDVISMHMAGVKNVVASSGTALTSGQIKLIKRYTQNVTLLFDGDRAGLGAAVRGVDIILEQGCFVKVVMFPEGEDPDSYSQKLGAEGFQKYLKEESQDFIDFRINLIKEGNINEPQEKAKAIRSIAESISKIPDHMTRSLYVQNTSNKLNIEEAMLLAEVNKIALKKAKQAKAAEEREKRLKERSKEGGKLFKSPYQGNKPLKTPSFRPPIHEDPPVIDGPPAFAPMGDIPPPIDEGHSEGPPPQAPPPTSFPYDAPPITEEGSFDELRGGGDGYLEEGYSADGYGEPALPAQNQRIAESLLDETLGPLSSDEVIDRQEKEFIRLLLRIGQQKLNATTKVCDYLLDANEKEPLFNPTYQQLVNEYRENLEKDFDVTESYFIEHENEQVRNIAIDVLIDKYSLSENWFKLFEISVAKEDDPEVMKKAIESNIFRLKIRVIQKMIDDLIIEIQQIAKFEEQIPVLELLKEYKEIEKNIAKVLGMVISR